MFQRQGDVVATRRVRYSTYTYSIYIHTHIKYIYIIHIKKLYLRALQWDWRIVMYSVIFFF